MTKIFHRAVLVNEVLEFLNVKPEKKYIDATAGYGGYTGQILKKGGVVLGIDWDREAVDFLKKEFVAEISQKRLALERENFAKIAELAQKHNFKNCAGIVFDLGVSAHQLEIAKRGFSFAKAGPLDMRMNQDLGVTAKDLVAALSAKELAGLFTKFGERNATRIASAIVKTRLKTPIETTSQLASLVRKIVKTRGVIDPATKVFLALRAIVNFELENLKSALPEAFSILGRSGRLLVISFHSEEDSIVKDFFKKTKNLAILTPKPVRPEMIEVLDNPSSRSARLRVGEKIS